MFRIIEPGQRGAHLRALTRMHELRDRVVVGQWGWDIPGALPGFEQDQFDGDDTVYVLVEDEDGGVSACARLNPTTQPHMMTELFADYCDLQPAPAGEDIRECSRFVIDTVSINDPYEVFRLRCRLGIGITTWCLDQDVTQLTWLTHQRFYNHVSGLFRTEPLGRPRRQEGEWAWIAAVSHIELAALDRQLDRFRRTREIVAELTAAKQSEEGGQAA